MTGATSVSMTVLRAALDRVLGEVQRRHGDVVDLDADLYYVLPAESVYAPGTVPDGQACTLGSLVDDVDAVRELAAGGLAEEGEEAEVVVWHDLAHVIGVLQRLAAIDRP
ncbi:hypothetical protein [Kineococcus xinjiangensis]|nr:hypothetical protein [Kineococcus xinjiangensis]